MTHTLMTKLNQSTVPLYQKYKNLSEMVQLKFDSVIDHTVHILENKPLSGTNHLKLPKELDQPRKGLINIKNIDDNEYLKWCLVRYWHPADHHPARIRKIDKDVTTKLDFKDIKYPGKIKDTHRVEKKIVSALVFLVIKMRGNTQSIYISKNTFKKTCWFIIYRGWSSITLYSY